MTYKILHYPELDSTNDEAIRLACDGASEGTVVITDFQKKGRGRFKRKWRSSKGEDLLFSLIVRPQKKVVEIPIITHYAARAVKETLEECAGICCALKKPNDVLVNGKKISGILAECETKGSFVAYVIIGVGINVNSPKKHLLKTATSLLVETGKKWKREEILEVFLEKFEEAEW